MGLDPMSATSRLEQSVGARLSVSMIVRNEGRRIAATIQAIAPLADEICIVDTGSNDDTVHVARELGCRVEHFTWCDDFAAARNAALALCQHPWIFSLDADEMVAEADFNAFRALITQPPRQAHRFVTRNYTDDETSSGYEPLEPGDGRAAGFRGYFPSAKVRLIPNVPGVCFEGFVHELPNPSLDCLQIPIVDTAIPVHHYPLLNAQEGARARKQALYLDLGRKKVSDHPRDAKAHSELGDQYVDMGAIAAAVDAYKTAVALEPHRGIWMKNLGSALFLLGHYPQALQALRLAVTQDPTLEEGWRNLGVVLLQKGDWEGAREALDAAVHLNGRHPDNLRYLAIARSSCGDDAGAMAVLERLLARFPTHTEARALYERLRADGGAPDPGEKPAPR